jgi:diketogulonate reductase-like aldo/keto reductase
MIHLSSGFDMPALGFGTSSISDPSVFYTAVNVGYRHFDTATKYGNEAALGEALNRAITEGLVTRE